MVNLFNAPAIFKPFHYPWAYDFWSLQQKMHWLPEEVPLHDDLLDWEHKLTNHEKHLCTQIFRFFTQADVEVQDCYLGKYANIFKPVEIKMMLAAFTNMETVHVDAYSKLVETLGADQDFYADFLKFKEMRDKTDFLHSFSGSTKKDLAITLAVYGGFIEGMQLFASFAILFNFQRFGKMKGMGQIVTWSVRDEDLHTRALAKLFRTMIEENPELWTDELKDEIYKCCTKAVYFEDEFIKLAFEGGAIEGLTPEDVSQYIRYIADKRLVALGLKPMYMINKNPLPWMEYMLQGNEFANFFENRSTEYGKSATEGQWDDAF